MEEKGIYTTENNEKIKAAKIMPTVVRINWKLAQKRNMDQGNQQLGVMMKTKIVK